MDSLEALATVSGGTAGAVVLTQFAKTLFPSLTGQVLRMISALAGLVILSAGLGASKGFEIVKHGGDHEIGVHLTHLPAELLEVTPLPEITE